jgi:hypothetical protein
MQFPRIKPRRKTGEERFRSGDGDAGFKLLDFWQWTTSDLVSNSTRGVLAEFLVARALGVDTGVRDEWQAFDLVTPTGKKVEVKSAAYVQSWGQKELSRIVFSTRHTLAWDAETGAFAADSRPHADIYVFALLAHRDKDTIDPLNRSMGILRGAHLGARRLHSQSAFHYPEVAAAVVPRPGQIRGVEERGWAPAAPLPFQCSRTRVITSQIRID